MDPDGGYVSGGNTYANWGTHTTGHYWGDMSGYSYVDGQWWYTLKAGLDYRGHSADRYRASLRDLEKEYGGASGLYSDAGYTELLKLQAAYGMNASAPHISHGTFEMGQYDLKQLQLSTGAYAMRLDTYSDGNGLAFTTSGGNDGRASMMSSTHELFKEMSALGNGNGGIVVGSERLQGIYYEGANGKRNYISGNLAQRNGGTGPPVVINPPSVFEMPIIRNIPLVKALSIIKTLGDIGADNIKVMLEPKGKTTRVSKGQMKLLQKNGFDPHKGKPPQGNGNKIDFWFDENKDLFWKQENSNHYERLFENIYDILGH